MPPQIREVIESHLSHDERAISVHERLPQRVGVLDRRWRSQKQNQNEMTHRSSI